jgi:ABC-type multidrug transport system fused ATPase/permease subunit
MDLIEITKKNKKGFALILFLLVLEHLAWVLEPTLFGNLIDVFIEDKNLSTLFNSPARYLPFLFWVGAYFVNSGAGAVRRSLEPKIFQRMLAGIVTKIAEQAKKEEVDVSIAAGRAQLSQEYVTFFQYRVPEGLEQIISIVGAIAALSFFDYRIAAACLVVAMPLIYMGQIYNTKVAGFQKEYFDDYEQLFSVFVKKDEKELKNFFSSIEKSKRKIGFWNAANFSIMRFVLLIIFIVVLIIAIDMDDFSTGNIFSIVAYLWTFMSSVEYLPELMESRIAIKDISRRIKN